MEAKDVKVLVTGGAGFIGSNIAREAARRGYEVRILDNLHLGSRDNLTGIAGLEFVRDSVLNERAVAKAVNGVDCVFHQAAVSSSQMFVPDPREGTQVNLRGFLNVLHYARMNKVKKVVYALTSTIYGNTPLPWKEQNISMQDCPNAYAYSLLGRTFFGKLYAEKHGLDTIGLIYFSVYGPFERAKGKYANIVSQFLWAMKQNEAPVLYGDGSQTRDFIHVDDVAEANLMAAESQVSGEIFNVGTGRETSMKSIVDMLCRALDKKISPSYSPNPIQGYCYHTRADTTKAQRILGFRTRISIEEGLQKLVEFYADKRADQ